MIFAKGIITKHMDKKDNIKAYDGVDAYYEGTETDYEEFLKSVDGKINTSAEAVSDNSNDIGGETINIKGVLDIVRKKAEKFGTAAQKVVNDFKTSTAEKNEDKKPKSAKISEESTENVIKAAEPADDKPPEISEITATISETAKAAKNHVKNVALSAEGKIDDIISDAIQNSVDGLSSRINDVVLKIDKASSKLNEIEVKQIETKNCLDRNTNDVRISLTDLSNDISAVKQSFGTVSKLNDSVFDLKNTQQNLKKSISDLYESVNVVKKKQVISTAILTVIGIIVIALEFIILLS